MNVKIYKCDLCLCKTYKTRIGLLKHKNKIHKLDNIEIKYECSKCNKILSCRQNKWRHEKICNNNDLIITKEEFQKLKNEIENMKNNNNIIINNNNTINNENCKQIIINYSPGTEPINHLTLKQQKEER